MIVNSIRLKNFKSYYGSDNEFKFKKGLNIISGHEGAGKTNLFDAFIWALFNKSSDSPWAEEIDEENILFINDRIKNERFKSKSYKPIDCDVIINITMPKSESHPIETTYEISRTKSISLVKNSTTNQTTWKYDKTKFSLSWEDSSFNTIIEYDRDAEVILHRIFPEKIRKYIWFQGEKLNELLDFGNSETFESAIDFISYLSTYEEMSNLIKDTHDLLVKKQLNIIRKNNKNKTEFDKYTRQLEIAERELKKSINDQKKYKLELNQLEKDEKAQIDKLSVLAGMPELLEKKKSLELNAKKLRDEVSAINDNEKKLFITKWMLKGTLPLLEESRSQLQSFIDYRLTLIAQNNKQLAEGTPGDELVNQMLNKEHCIICDTPAPKGSKNYKSIQSHLDTNKQLKPLDPAVEDLNDKVINLKGKPDQLLRKLANVDDEIIEHKANIAQKIENHKKLQDDFAKVKNDIDEIVRAKGQSVLNMNPQQIEDTLKLIRQDLKVTNGRIARGLVDINVFKANKISALEKLGALKNKNTTSSVEDKLTDYTKYIQDIIKQQEIRQREELVKKIEKKANDIQKTVANVNNIIIVYVKIDSDYNIHFVDADGKRNPPHKAQKTMAQMSIINAIISLSNEMRGLQYPFISDAPMSDFGPDFTPRFLESISKTYEQSIIITKDLTNDTEAYKAKGYVSNFIDIFKNKDPKVATLSNSVTEIKN